MALFKDRGMGRGARGLGQGARDSGKARGSGGTRPQPPVPSPQPLRRALWLLGGIAAMAIGGYLVAALVLFPAPLLPNEREVPRVLGMRERAARGILAGAGLTVESGREPHPDAPPGTVVWQDPPPGVAVPRGKLITLTVSDGPPRVAVPDVRGLDVELAQRLLAAAGLRVEGVDSVDVKTPLSGVAMGTTPAAGDSLALGRGVIVHLSK